MKVGWLFQTDVFDENTTRLMEEVKRQGYELRTISYTPIQTYGTSGLSFDGHYLQLFSPDSCVVFYGSLEFAAQVNRESAWIPGAFGNREEFDCLYYYPHLSEYLLAQEYIMLPYGELLRKKEFLYEYFGEDDTIFIRPNSGGKIFVGQTIYKGDFDKDVPRLGCYQIPSHELVVVSPSCNIDHEWRFVVADKKVITGSRYIWDGRRSWTRLRNEREDVTATAFAQTIAEAGYEPDRVWCVDVCQTVSERLYLLEIGCFSSAGLYACNPRPIVSEVSRIALEEWENVYGLRS